MAKQTSIVEEGFDRLQETFESVSDEVSKLQKRARRERRRLEKDAQKRVKRVRKELNKNAWVKAATRFANDTQKQIEGGVDSILARLPIASRGDLQRLDRKLNQVNRKLRELEKARAQAKRPPKPAVAPEPTTPAVATPSPVRPSAAASASGAAKPANPAPNPPTRSVSTF